jgi:hypothetical protein
MYLGKYARMVMDMEPNEGTRNILEFDSVNFIFTPFVFVDVPEAYILEYFQIILWHENDSLFIVLSLQ